MSVLAILLFFIASCIQLYFWVIQLDSVNRNSTNAQYKSKITPKVSLVIAAKNEYSNLKKHLPRWLDQDYPHFELIIVNDHSTDNTRSYAKQLTYPALTFLHLSGDSSGKKDALTHGINSSQSEWILTTDADCFPQSNRWISEMMRHCDNSDIIIGFGPYINDRSLLSDWISYETWYIAMQYFSAALRNWPYMGVGRNMAFRKTVFESVNGYINHRHIKSGDDDLFISTLSKEYRYSVSSSKESWTWSYPKKNFSDYLNQKRRHLSTSPHYERNIKFWLSTIFISQLVWYVALVFLTYQYPWLIAFWLMRSFIIVMVAKRSESKLGKTFNNWMLPVYDLLLTILYALLGVLFIFPKKDW